MQQFGLELSDQGRKWPDTIRWQLDANGRRPTKADRIQRREHCLKHVAGIHLHLVGDASNFACCAVTVAVTWNMTRVIYLFTSFSGHRPAQRECARTGLRSHARCHPYPIPQPVKVGHTTGLYVPYSFRMVMWVLLRPTRTNQWKCCETGPTVFRPPLEGLNICRCDYKGSTFFSVI